MFLLALVLRAALVRRGRPLTWYALSGLAVLAVLILTLASPTEYLRQNFIDFGTSGRLAVLPIGGGAHGAAVHPDRAGDGGAGLGGGPHRSRRFLPTLLMAVVVFVTGVFSLWTGSSLVVGGGYLVGVMALLLAAPPSTFRRRTRAVPGRVPARAWPVAAGVVARWPCNGRPAARS